MLIAATSRPEELAETGLRWWSDDRFTIGWKGHLFLPGERAGAPTIARFAQLLRQRPLAELARELYGVFGLFVHDRVAGGWQLAVDNAGLYKIFYDDIGASTSFLELLADRGRDATAVTTEALIEFLMHGFVAGPETLASRVLKLRADEILDLRADQVQARAKDLALPAGDDTTTVLRYFADLATSLRDRRVSADLSGGFDSRLIVGMLVHHGLDFEVAITGEPGSADVVLSERAARVVGRPFFAHRHDVGRLDEELPVVFLAGDGQHEMRGFPRDRQNALARLARGVDVITHGGGGDMFKDFQVAHEFPWYGSRRINLERYYELRFAPLHLPSSLLSRRAAACQTKVRARTLAKMESYRATTNNETFDQVAFFLRDPEFFGRYYSNYINLGLDVVAPFLDWRNAAVARSLSPWRRFMNGWHRELLTRYCPQLATLPTTDGYSASTEWRRLLPDLLGFIRNAIRRVLRKVGQRLLGRSVLEKPGVSGFNAPGYVARLRASPHFAAAVACLKTADVLAVDAEPTKIPDFYVPRVLTVGMLLAHLEGRAAASRAAREAVIA